MLVADLYLETIALGDYLPGTDCGECGFATCAAFAAALKRHREDPGACTSLSSDQVARFRLVLNAAEILPQVPALDLPRPGATGIVEINQPDRDSPILVTGNSEFTQEVVTTFLGYTLSPFWLVYSDCRGDTVDMAVIYQSLRAEKVASVLDPLRPSLRASDSLVILPGLAAGLQIPLEEALGLPVAVGPRCVAELPLFMGDKWRLVG